MYGFYSYSAVPYSGLLSSAVVATSYTFIGPTAGAVGNTLVYTLQANGTTNATVTPATTGSGVFSPTTRQLNDTSAVTFTYTPSAAGTVTLSVTNNGGLSNPPNITLVVSAAAANRNIASARTVASSRTIASSRIIASNRTIAS